MPELVGPLEARVRVEASPAAVWTVVADQRRMNEWSPETREQKFFGEPIGRGTFSINLNQRKGFVWPTASRITEFVPEQRLEFYVYGPAAFWSYELEPDGSGTLVTERRTLRGGKRSLLTRLTASAALGGVLSHEGELLEGMNVTLARIKSEAESA